jgi:hypothetical protein
MITNVTYLATRIFGILKKERKQEKSIKELNQMTLGEIIDLRKDYEKDLKETLLHYIKTHPHCSEIIIVKPCFLADVFICNHEDVEKLDCRVKLNLTV